MRQHIRKTAGILAVALFAGSVGGCDIVDLTPPESNPNSVGDVSLFQLLVAAQVNSYFYNESEAARLAGMWTQQLFGADRQFATLELFQYGETDGEDNWSILYRQGGLWDIRQGLRIAEETDQTVVAGILKIHEAYLIGMAASWWGDLPYSDAVDPAILDPDAGPEVLEPTLDPQMEVYAAVQSLLDEAITDLEAGSVPFPIGGADLNFGGDPAKWIDVARTLKARFYMHVAQAQGASAYQAALAQAELGVMDPANNWVGVHSGAATENNLWYMFQRDRSGYIVPDDDLVEMLEARSDPRRDIYFNAAADNIAIPATPDYDQPIVSCSETFGILAEASYQLGATEDARTYAQRMVDECQEPYWSGILGVPVDIPFDASAVDAADLLPEIMTEKYIAQFLNPDVWTDYRRTCLPDVPTPGGLPVPERLYYPDVERQANTNIPQSPPANYEDLQLPSFPEYPGICG